MPIKATSEIQSDLTLLIRADYRLQEPSLGLIVLAVYLHPRPRAVYEPPASALRETARTLLVELEEKRDHHRNPVYETQLRRFHPQLPNKT